MVWSNMLTTFVEKSQTKEEKKGSIRSEVPTGQRKAETTLASIDNFSVTL